jgi:hypothetical protein
MPFRGPDWPALTSDRCNLYSCGGRGTAAETCGPHALSVIIAGRDHKLAFTGLTDTVGAVDGRTDTR